MGVLRTEEESEESLAAFHEEHVEETLVRRHRVKDGLWSGAEQAGHTKRITRGGGQGGAGDTLRGLDRRCADAKPAGDEKGRFPQWRS
jgi:hypothetical protein